MPKFKVSVTVPVFVMAEIEAEDEEEAERLAEDLDFSVQWSMNMGGSIGPKDREMGVDHGEPDYDSQEIYEVK